MPHPVEGQDHKVCRESCFSSPDLFADLEKKERTVGGLSARQGRPQDIRNKKMN